MQNKSFSKNILGGIRSRLNKLLHNSSREANLSAVKKIYYKHISPGKVRKHVLFGKSISFIKPVEFLHGMQEIFVDEIYKQKLPLNAFIIDCGANIGLSVIYLKKRFPDSEILAFEPDTENFKILEENIREFGFSNVSLRKEAIWIQNTILEFSEKGSMDSKLVPNKTEHSVPINAIRLANLISRKVDFLKIDIEGAEFEVLLDIQNVLHFVNNLFLEYHGQFDQNQQLNQMLSIIVNNGFKYYIKEAAQVFKTPFFREGNTSNSYDIQLNIFCFRD